MFRTPRTPRRGPSNHDITDDGSSGLGAGLYIQPQSGAPATVTIDRSRINNNYFGIIADGTGGSIVRGAISDSVVSGNTNNGITVTSTGANVVSLVDQTKVSANNFGLVATDALQRNAEAVRQENDCCFGRADPPGEH